MAILLLPIALGNDSRNNLRLTTFFPALGVVPSQPVIRDGHIRSQGPFRHSILAGTVGAVFLPLMVALWYKDRKVAIVGILSCLSMVICARSSGPIVSFVAALGGLFMWHYRHNMKDRTLGSRIRLHRIGPGDGSTGIFSYGADSYCCRK